MPRCGCRIEPHRTPIGPDIVVLSKEYCCRMVTVINLRVGNRSTALCECDKWHTWVVHWINTTNRSAHREPGGWKVLSSTFRARFAAQQFSAEQWQQGCALLNAIKVPNIEKVVLETSRDAQNIPDCLSSIPRTCRVFRAAADVVSSYIGVERAAAKSPGPASSIRRLGSVLRRALHRGTIRGVHGQ